jgi:hypothetical protein
MGQSHFKQLGLFAKEFEPAISVDADQLGGFERSGGSQPSFLKAQTTESNKLVGTKHRQSGLLPSWRHDGKLHSARLNVEESIGHIALRKNNFTLPKI